VPFDDLVSSGYIGLVNAADRFDPAQGNFERYAWFVVKGAIIDAHKRRAYKEEQHESIDEWQERRDDGRRIASGKEGRWLRDCRPLPDAQAVQRDDQRNIQMLIAKLPPDMAQLIRAFMAGDDVNEVARQWGRSAAWARARLAKAKNQIGAGMMLL
jgi:RNA polymerase sigma factor (sigma-70 family)